MKDQRPSPAQQASRERNWRIFRLRSVWSYASLLTGDRAERMRGVVDEELTALGAEPEGLRREREMDEAWR